MNKFDSAYVIANEDGKQMTFLTDYYGEWSWHESVWKAIRYETIEKAAKTKDIILSKPQVYFAEKVSIKLLSVHSLAEE